MPTPGLALIGFMDRDQAFNFLRTRCICGDISDAALGAVWQQATQQRGAAFAKAGKPEILPIPAGFETHLNQLKMMPWITGSPQPLTFQMVEIDPLLAFQFQVETDRSNQHCGRVGTPTVADVLPICLPLANPSDQYVFNQQAQSVIVRSRSLNLQFRAGGMLQQNMPGMPDVAGLAFDWSNPLVHVVRYNGRCYLHNGYHRAYGMRKAGATHIPCVFRDVPDAATAGIKTQPFTFEVNLLESSDPPTLGHFTQDRSLACSLRIVSRILTVSWAECVMFEE